jgi:hypothetical protein
MSQLPWNDPTQRLPGERLIAFYRRAGHEELTGFEERALNAFESLPRAGDWKIPGAGLSDFQPALDLGLLAVLLAKANADRLLTTAVKEMIELGYVPPWLGSELHAAALLRRLGLEATFVKAGKSKTPDIAVPWLATKIDVEVTFGERKLENAKYQNRMSDLQAAIPFRGDADLVVYLFGDLSDEIFSAVTSAAPGVKRGQFVEHAGHWRVAATTPQSAATGGEMADLRPAGWAPPSLMSVGVRIEGAAAQRIEVTSLFPEEVYLNPIRRKTDHPQRSGKLPYVVAYDVGHLPNARKSVLDWLTIAFPALDHVAGALLFYPIFATAGSKAWRAQLVRNPHATESLPHGFLAALGDDLTEVPLDQLPSAS